MISKPINSVLKYKFTEIFNAATARALNDYNLFENKLHQLDNHFDKFKLLYDETRKYDKLTEEHPHPYYVQNHSSEDWLLDQFTGRCFLLNVDESDVLGEAIYLGAYDWNISQKYYELKKEIPKYSYEQFLNGSVCKYLDNLEKAFNIDEKDYYKIRQWQSENLVTIVDYQCQLLIKKVQQHCKSLEDPLKFILEEKEKIEAIDKLPYNGQLLKEQLSKLYIFNDFDLSALNNESVENNFRIYKDEQLSWQGVYPHLLKSLLEKVETKDTKPFASETTIFFVINKVADWYETVLDGQSLQQEMVSTNWDQLFEQLLLEVKLAAEETMEPIEEYAYNEELPKEDVKKYLIEKFEIYRYKFNSFKKKHLFGLVDEEYRETLRKMFMTNAFFGNDLQGEYDAIKEAMLIHEVSWEIAGIYGDIFDTHRFDYPGKNGSHIEIMSLLNQMVIDKELYIEEKKIMNDFMEHFHSYRLPIEMYFQNHREEMSGLFQKALDRLENHLDDAEPTNKILYMQTRLKELRHRELRFKQLKDEFKYDDDLRYSTLFKEFLEIEAAFITNTKDIDALPALTHTPQKKHLITASQAKTFDEAFPGEKGQFVMELLEGLSITIDGKAQLAPKKVGAIRGVVEALRESLIAPQLNLNSLCCMVAEKIGIQIKSGKIDASTTSGDFLKQAKQFISANYKASKKV